MFYDEIGCYVNKEFYPHYRFNWGSKSLPDYLSKIEIAFSSDRYSRDAHEVASGAKHVADSFVKSTITAIKSIHMNIRQIEENVEKARKIKDKEKRDYEYAIQYARLCNCFDMIAEIAQGSNPESTFFNNVDYVSNDIDIKSLFDKQKYSKNDVWDDMFKSASCHERASWFTSERYFNKLSEKMKEKYLKTIDKIKNNLW